MPPEVDDTIDDAPPVDDLANLKALVSKQNKYIKELERGVRAKSGIDLDEYNALKAEKEEREQKEAEAKGQYEKLIGAERKRAEEAQAKYKAAIEKAYESQTDATLVSAFAANGGKPEHLDNFKVLAKSKLTKDAEGQYVIPDAYTNDKGEQITDFAEFVSVARDKDGLGFAFEPVNKSQGSGDTGGKSPLPTTAKFVSPAEAGNYIKEIAAGEVQVKG